MATTDQKTWTALWTPGWYELDQPLAVGQSDRFWFYRQAPADLPDVESYELVFFNQLSAVANCQVRTAQVESIEHPDLGSLARIDTDGLDYVFITAGGDRIVVNAEENPGTIFENPLSLPSIDDWSVSVVLGAISEPLANDPGSS